jgi:general stress protein 26
VTSPVVVPTDLVCVRAAASGAPEEPAMTTQQPENPDPEDLIKWASAVVNADRFPFLATIDGDQPRIRPISPLKTDGFTVVFANLRSYNKTAEIQANPKVELCYLDEHHDQVRITGVAEAISERAVIEAIWQSSPLLRKYLGSIDNPELILYRVRPTRVRFMKEWALTYFEVPLRS